MTADEFKAAIKRAGDTYAQASAKLGPSTESIKNYALGRRWIPTVVAKLMAHVYPAVRVDLTGIPDSASSLLRANGAVIGHIININGRFTFRVLPGTDPDILDSLSDLDGARVWGKFTDAQLTAAIADAFNS